jgi:hypothetical protein
MQQPIADSHGKDAPELPSPPRPLTRLVRRRAWLEPGVKVWWMSAAAIALIASALGGVEWGRAYRQRRLLAHGIEVTAHVEKARGGTIAHRHVRNEPIPVTLSFTLPAPHAQTPQTVTGVLRPRPEAFVQVGTALTIHVDPSDPSQWTEHALPKPWLEEMLVVSLLTPLVVLLLLAAWLRRRGVLALWRAAPLVRAEVIDQGHSAAAPRSRLLRLRIESDPHRRVLTALYPIRLGPIAAGDGLWVICRPESPQRALVAEAYARP